ncbi:MAG: hypothetical protein JXQ23_00365 [Clostridia bacterium]|nr:hypothetical protein [Clostridia bacterium]
MDKIKKFESIRTIKLAGVLTSIVFFIGFVFYILNAVIYSGSIFSVIFPVVFFIIGILMFLNPTRKIFFIYVSAYFLYFVINVGLIFFISGYEYIGQIVFEAIWLVYFIYKYFKIKNIMVTKEEIAEYGESVRAFDKNDLFYLTATNYIQTTRWICTLYEEYILVKRKYKFNLMLVDKKKFKFDFSNTSTSVLIGYIYYNDKREMCRMKKSEYDAYKKLMRKKYVR